MARNRRIAPAASGFASSAMSNTPRLHSVDIAPQSRPHHRAPRKPVCRQPWLRRPCRASRENPVAGFKPRAIRASYNRVRQRMFAPLFHGRRQPDDIFFAEAIQRPHARHHGLAGCNRAGLIHHDRIHLRRSLEAFAALESGFRAPRRVRCRHMIAVGVARPIAQGQAMIRTATAFTTATPTGAKNSQTAKVTSAIASTATVK